jgi:hypothetical protein
LRISLILYGFDVGGARSQMVAPFTAASGWTDARLADFPNEAVSGAVVFPTWSADGLPRG